MKVLVSYAPVAKSLQAITFHTNSVESRAIIESFLELGHQVDFIDCRNDLSDSEISKYEILFGEGPALVRAVKARNRNQLKIFYATTQSPLKVYEKEYLSYVRQNLDINSGHFRSLDIMNNLPLLQSDVIVCLGNANTRDTYNFCIQPIYQINPTGFDSKFIENPIKLKDKKNLLFFSGGGAALKGVYHVIDFIKENPSFNLIVCGPVCKQILDLHEFFMLSPRLTLYEHIYVPSDEWHKIVSSCYFALFPSYSEGASTSLITCLRAGLIPIASKEVGVDIGDNGFLIKELSSSGLAEAIIDASKTSEEKLIKMSDQIYEISNQEYNIYTYKKNITEILSAIISRPR